MDDDFLGKTDQQLWDTVSQELGSRNHQATKQHQNGLSKMAYVPPSHCKHIHYPQFSARNAINEHSQEPINISLLLIYMLYINIYNIYIYISIDR